MRADVGERGRRVDAARDGGGNDQHRANGDGDGSAGSDGSDGGNAWRPSQVPQCLTPRRNMIVRRRGPAPAARGQRRGGGGGSALRAGYKPHRSSALPPPRAHAAAPAPGRGQHACSVCRQGPAWLARRFRCALLRRAGPRLSVRRPGGAHRDVRDGGGLWAGAPGLPSAHASRHINAAAAQQPTQETTYVRCPAR